MNPEKSKCSSLTDTSLGEAGEKQQAIHQTDVFSSRRTTPAEFDNRVAFTPAEFAAKFGRHQTWAYRLLYAGHVKAIKNSGRILIPKSELDRFVNDIAVYAEIVGANTTSKPAI